MDERGRRGPWLAAALAWLGLLLWACLPEPECGPEACAGYVDPLRTRAVAIEATQVALETWAAELEVWCGEVWDQCCSPGTLTAAATAVHTPLATPTAHPAARAEP